MAMTYTSWQHATLLGEDYSCSLYRLIGPEDQGNTVPSQVFFKTLQSNIINAACVINTDYSKFSDFTQPQTFWVEVGEKAYFQRLNTRAPWDTPSATQPRYWAVKSIDLKAIWVVLSQITKLQHCTSMHACKQ